MYVCGRLECSAPHIYHLYKYGPQALSSESICKHKACGGEKNTEKRPLETSPAAKGLMSPLQEGLEQHYCTVNPHALGGGAAQMGCTAALNTLAISQHPPLR